MPSDQQRLLDQRKASIDELFVRGDPDAYATLIEIAAGDHKWPERLVAENEMETRCMAQRHLGDGPIMPQLGIGRVWLRYVARMSWPRTAAEVVSLLDDAATCAQRSGPARSFADAAIELLEWCPIPGLRNLLVDRHLDYPVHINDLYLSQQVGPAATRIEDAVARGGAPAFIAALQAIETTSVAERSEAVREGLAIMNWLRHLLLQDPKYKCCGPLQEAVRTGSLGDALLTHLRTEPDPRVRSAIWYVFSVQPKDGSRAVFMALLEAERDSDVRYDAQRSIDAMDHGGERAIDMRHDAEDAAHGLTPTP